MSKIHYYTVYEWNTKDPEVMQDAMVHDIITFFKLYQKDLYIRCNKKLKGIATKKDELFYHLSWSKTTEKHAENIVTRHSRSIEKETLSRLKRLKSQFDKRPEGYKLDFIFNKLNHYINVESRKYRTYKRSSLTLWSSGKDYSNKLPRKLVFKIPALNKILILENPYETYKKSGKFAKTEYYAFDHMNSYTVDISQLPAIAGSPHVYVHRELVFTYTADGILALKVPYNFYVTKLEQLYKCMTKLTDEEKASAYARMQLELQYLQSTDETEMEEENL